MNGTTFAKLQLSRGFDEFSPLIDNLYNLMKAVDNDSTIENGDDEPVSSSEESESEDES